MNDLPGAERHAIRRVRHELRRRLLTVQTAERLTPRMIRVTLKGDDLAGFVSDGFDDHVKLFFPAAERNGAEPPPMRDYTPRRYDPAAGTLTVDFALHEAGPATQWATQAAPGQTLQIGGPRGSFVVTDDFDWYLLVGDETALPAIGRRLEELRPGVRAIVVATAAGPEEEQAFESRAALETHWVHRPLARATDPAPLLQAIAALPLPKGDGYAWVAGESLTAKAIRQHLVVERSLRKAWVKAAGYWRSGSTAIHDTHDD